MRELRTRSAGIMGYGLKAGLGKKTLYQMIHRYLTATFPEEKIEQMEDGAPFLMKNKNGTNWIRIFFESMDFFETHYLHSEIKRLRVLMPDIARLRLFFPKVSGGSLAENEGLEIYEYQLREWVAGEYEIEASRVDSKTLLRPGLIRAVRPPAKELGFRKFNPAEVRDFAHLSLFLRRRQGAQAA